MGVLPSSLFAHRQEGAIYRYSYVHVLHSHPRYDIIILCFFSFVRFHVFRDDDGRLVIVGCFYRVLWQWGYSPGYYHRYERLLCTTVLESARTNTDDALKPPRFVTHNKSKILQYYHCCCCCSRHDACSTDAKSTKNYRCDRHHGWEKYFQVQLFSLMVFNCLVSITVVVS